MTTGEKIAALRREKGLSQEALGERLGLSRQAVSKWEAEQAVPTMDNLMELSRLFGVPVDTLLRPDEALPGGGPPEGVKLSAEGLKISYAPVLTKKTKWFIIALAVLIGVSVLGNLYAMVRVQAMQEEMGRLQEQLNGMSGQIAGLYAQPVIEQPTETDEAFSQVSVDCGFDGKMLNFSIYAVPRQFDSGETAKILVQHGADKGNYEYEVEVQQGGYKADINIEPVDDCKIYLQLTKDGQTRTMLVRECRQLNTLYALSGYLSAAIEWQWGAIQPFTATVVIAGGVTEWGERPTKPVGGTAELLVNGVVVETQTLALVPEGEPVHEVNGQLIQYGSNAICLTCDFARHKTDTPDQYEVRAYVTDNFGREFPFSSMIE